MCYMFLSLYFTLVYKRKRQSGRPETQIHRSTRIQSEREVFSSKGGDMLYSTRTAVWVCRRSGGLRSVALRFDCLCLQYAERSEELLAGDALLHDHAGDGDHGEPAVVELLILHREQLGGVRRLEAEGVKAEVPRHEVFSVFSFQNPASRLEDGSPAQPWTIRNDHVAE